MLGKMRGYGFVSRWTVTLKVLTEETVKRGGEIMARKYLHELTDWPAFTWNAKTLVPLLSGVRRRREYGEINDGVVNTNAGACRKRLKLQVLKNKVADSLSDREFN
ncbi:MAG: DUF4172 domain-containing protein [Candidatus Acidiferrum sp.]